MKIWNIEALTGYKPKTTFWEDFSIADAYGLEAIQDTFERAFEAWKDDVVFVTELVMVLNWKAWAYEKNPAFCKLYCKLYEEARNWCWKNLKGNDLDYFYLTTD